MSTISWVTGSTIVYLSIIFPTLIIAPLSSCDTAREGATRDFNVQIYANKYETGINILSSEMACKFSSNKCKDASRCLMEPQSYFVIFS